jgi:hypothetical protein
MKIIDYIYIFPFLTTTNILQMAEYTSMNIAMQKSLDRKNEDLLENIKGIRW